MGPEGYLTQRWIVPQVLRAASRCHHLRLGEHAVLVRLKGIHKVKCRRANGEIATYYYAWRGGPRLVGQPGTPQFMQSYNQAIASRRLPPQGTLFTLIADFRASAEFLLLSNSTKRAYASYLAMIEIEFGDMPIEALSDPEVRGVFKRWRDAMAHTPRKADYAWSTLARVLSVAHDRGRIPINPCERGGRLYEADRAQKIWNEDDIGRLLAVASPNIAMLAMLALWTGQRQGDLLRLPWSAYDGTYIRLRQSKTGRHVTIPVGIHLKHILDSANRISTQVLTNERRRPWTSDGFRTSWSKTCIRAGLANDLHFHDLRGSVVVRLAVAEATVPEIATFTGHSLKDVEAILDKHYLGRDVRLAESAVRKLERKEKRTKTVKGG
jgi:integrase